MMHQVKVSPEGEPPLRVRPPPKMPPPISARTLLVIAAAVVALFVTALLYRMFATGQ